jgi:hypothetical protein
MNKGEKKKRWYQQTWLWLALGAWLVISYAISPKIATYSVYDELVVPQKYAVRIVNIPAAQFLPDGNLLACLTVELKPGAKTKDYSLVVPLKNATDPESEIVKKRTKRLIGRGDDFSLMIDDSQLISGCSDVQGDAKIYLNPALVDEPRNARNNVQATSDFELLVGAPFFATEHDLIFLSRTPLRWVQWADDEGRPGRVVPEHYVGFEFPRHTSGARWWNGIFFLVAIPIDAITGPLGWILVFNPHSRPYEG